MWSSLWCRGGLIGWGRHGWPADFTRAMDAIAGKLSEWKANGGLGATRRSASTSQREKWQRRGKWCSGEASRGLMRGRWKAGRPCATGKSPSRPPSPFSAIRKCGKNDPSSPLTARYCYSALHRLNISSSVHILRCCTNAPFAGLPSIASQCIAMPNPSRQTLVPPSLLFAHLRNPQHAIFGLVVKARAPASLAPLQ